MERCKQGQRTTDGNGTKVLLVALSVMICSDRTQIHESVGSIDWNLMHLVLVDHNVTDFANESHVTSKGMTDCLM